MISIRQNGDIYDVAFPYDVNVIYLVKNVPGRRWVPDRKVWTIPKDRLGFFINQLKGTVYEAATQVFSDEDINVNATLDSTAVIPDVDISDIPFYVKEGATPYKHQLEFMKWAIDRQRRGNMSGFLQCDDQGLAKTCQSMNLALYNREQYGFKHCLVVCCINSSKYNWQNDIRDHTRGAEQPYILGSRLKRNGTIRCDTGGAEKTEDLQKMKMYGSDKGDELPYFLVVNIEAFRYRVGKKYPFKEAVVDAIKKHEIQMVIVDEIHKNASMKAIQGKNLLAVKKATAREAMWVPMTGTPIVGKPTDVFLPLKLVDGHSFSSYYSWCNYFCMYAGFGGHEIVGYKNIPKLKEMLHSNMIRRLKSEVLDLPPKIHYTEYVENSPYQRKLYSSIASDIVNNKEEIVDSMNPLARFLRLRQVNGSPELVDSTVSADDPDYLKKNAKLVRVLELIEDNIERGEKTVVFSNWVEPLRTLYKFVSKRCKTCVFTGTMSAERREQHKRVFMTNPEYMVLLGTIGAAGTTHTFTAAKHLIFYDEPWNPSDKVQAEDRIYRIGTTSSVTITTLISKFTVDDRVHDILYTKEGVSGFIVDNKLDIYKNPKLFDMLLSDTLK